ncbi:MULTISPECIES: helix-turn-helix domain-containing protein [unclassified Sphingomonas]|uniref:helix-turn-helix domain-containing protein n=1 Tax=unclassified Sphingomonas TaxID=196159 RepID=UPI00226ABC53|nr:MULTISPECIES: helix-turn-helix domain-containing protein [unclassified Sphingomonas]
MTHHDVKSTAVERQRLYDQGLGDSEIARLQGCDKSSVREWRLRKGLPVNFSRTQTRKVTAKQYALRRAMYDAGCTDPVIAKAVGITDVNVCLWRRREGLPPNTPPGRNAKADPNLAIVTPDLKRRALALLERGVGARIIAREMGASLKSLDRWRTEMLRERPELRRPGTAPRRTPRHPSGRAYSKLRPERRARAFVLYADGLDDCQIAKDIGVTRHQIWEWRNALFLPAIGRSWRNHIRKPNRRLVGPAISPLSNPLYAHIALAVGRGLAKDLVDDTISEIWLAIAEGRLSTETVASQAGRYRNRVVADYASRFGPRSLDEEIGTGDGDGFRMIDMLKDGSSSDWLEAMGATVW